MSSGHEQHVAELADEVDGVRGEVGTVRSELRRLSEAVEKLHEEMVAFKEETKPILDVYNGALTIKTIIVGFASVVLALGAIGAGVIWVVNAVIQK